MVQTSERSRFDFRRIGLSGMGVILFTLWSVCAFASDSSPHYREQLIRFLAVRMGDARHEGKGTVGELVVGWEQRRDRDGLIVSFQRGKGDFSQGTAVAIILAIEHLAKVAELDTHSWSVTLRLYNPADATLFGESVSAMIGLSVVALSKGDSVLPDRVVTGTVTPEGTLGAVGAVSLKIMAAYRQHLHHVVVPDVIDPADADWQTPFLMQVSPTASLAVAYEALTDEPIVLRLVAPTSQRPLHGVSE